MNERKVVVYFHVAFETHKFTVSRKANISHVMSIDSLLFNLDVELVFIAGLTGEIKKCSTSLARERKIKQV